MTTIPVAPITYMERQKELPSHHPASTPEVLHSIPERAGQRLAPRGCPGRKVEEAAPSFFPRKSHFSQGFIKAGPTESPTESPTSAQADPRECPPCPRQAAEVEGRDTRPLGRPRERAPEPGQELAAAAAFHGMCHERGERRFQEASFGALLLRKGSVC